MLRHSRFNVIIDDGDAKLLFNTASGNLRVLDGKLVEAYEACRSPELEALGFLTARTREEELATLQDAFEAQRSERDELMLSIAPTYACNYRCPYCYEQGNAPVTGIMGERVMDGICDFIEARHAEHPFTRLSIQWYGGDPSLALDVVEELSEDMISWCDENRISYDALILTNCMNIDEESATMLERSQVRHALLTIDGFEETHNKRRVAANGSNSFEAVISGARLFKKHGMNVSAVMNVDRVNWGEYAALRDALAKDPGIPLSFERLADCGHFFGTRSFKKPEFDLFDIEEYARLQHDVYASQGMDADALRGLLAAPKRFCNGQRDNYFVIDMIGDIYACDGYIGDASQVKVSIFDEDAGDALALVSHDPFESEQCRECVLLPICLGNCNWERETDAMQCHPLKYSLPDYVRDLKIALKRERAADPA